MDYDFYVSTQSLRIPDSVYQAVKRCQFCNSVYINEKLCEFCGRSMLYHPVGEAFGPKSFYGIKERYIQNLQTFTRMYPQFEDRKSPIAKSYVRQLSKRFTDLLSAFNTADVIAADDRKLFYIESMELIDELLRYETHASILQALLEENDGSLIGAELLYYLAHSGSRIEPSKPWTQDFLNYRFFGLLRVEFFIKAVIISATVTTMAVIYKDIISSQFGR